jgi:hypothetical protein
VGGPTWLALPEILQAVDFVAIDSGFQESSKKLCKWFSHLPVKLRLVWWRGNTNQ